MSPRRPLASGFAIPLVLVALVAALLAASASSQPTSTPASYPSCGVYWNRNTPVSAAERRANSCIVTAWRKRERARVVAALTTVEGDPIVNYVLVHGRRDFLVIVDSTRDAFGAKLWSRMRCTDLFVTAGYLGWKGCRGTATGKPAWLKPVRLRR